ncbi:MULTISPECIES: hypothetical protein [Pseudomonas]|uniref:hypothetical protein n=1 Tax=Pseudomonas TaxID=286 RepID=UPI0010A66DF8|nr:MULTISPECIES: hypothetical protein [Pseudomonas]
MRNRGEKFWAWADPTLHHRYHDEVLVDGTKINVEVRLSRTGETQLFIGVYAQSGALIMEEAYYTRPHESMSRAMAWGVGRARMFANDASPNQSIQIA